MSDLILIAVIAVNIITSITSYLLHSRCTKITTPCCTIDRNILEEPTV